MRTRTVLVPLLAAFLLIPVVSARAKLFQLSSGQVDLQEVSSTVEVYYQAMRFNRASNQWNFELTLRNTAVRPLTGPVVVLVDAFQNTSGPVLPDGREEQGKAFYDVSTLIPNGGLPTGQESLARTLALGVTSGTPQMAVKVFALAAPVGPSLSFVRTLNEVGQPLASVTVAESGPSGQGTSLTDSRFGVATLGFGPGTNLYEFSAAGHFPVWRSQVLSPGSVVEVPSPRLLPRSTNSVSIGTAGGVATAQPGNFRLTIPSGAFAQNTTVTLTPASAQTLPALLPGGWSPVQVFWLDMSSEPSAAAACQFDLWEPIRTSDHTALVRWDASARGWEVVELVAGLGAGRITVQVPRSGAWALVVRDAGDVGVPAAEVGQRLPGVNSLQADYSQLVVRGEVAPATSAPSRQPELVTATASLTISNQAGTLTSGTLFRLKVSEEYRLRNGSVRRTPTYEAWVVGYQRPGDTHRSTLHASFPLRPLLLLDGEELLLGVVNADILPSTSFAGAVFTAAGGEAVDGPVRVAASAGVLARPQAAQLASLEATNFASLGAEAVCAFQLTIGELGSAAGLSLQVSNLPANGSYVLARVLSEDGVYGLEPVARYSSSADGRLVSEEPQSGPRLDGFTGSGQFVLAKVSGPQVLVRGTALNAYSNAAPGMMIRLAPWVTRSGPDGSYKLVATAGSTANLALLDPATGDTAGTTLQVPANQSLLTVPDQVTGSIGPRIVTVSPADGSTNVGSVASVVVTFSKPVNPGTALGEPLRLLGYGTNPVPAAFSLNLRGDQATLLPIEPLAPQTPYTLLVSSNLADLAGRTLLGPTQFGFRTAPQVFVRDAGAQLITYEPTNGAIRMRGTAGFSQPSQPVVLINETSGRTTTVLANNDGSFEGSLAADETDDLCVTVVNQNGSRDRLTPNRQIFRDGSVALFGTGGTLEVAGETGVAEFVVEPGAIASKTRLKIEALPMAQVLNLVSNVQPENGGKILGGFRMGPIQGPQLTRSMDVRFPVDLSTVLPAGVSPTNCIFGLCIARVVDGEQVFELVDRMLYEDGKLVTHSPPFFGLLGPYEDILVAPLLMYLNVVPLMVHGQVYAQEWDAVADSPLAGAPKQLLPGALVAGRPASDPIVMRGRLRPGSVYALSGAEGKYTILIPARVDTFSPFVGVEASHPRFPGVKARSALPDLTNGDRFLIGNVITKKDVVFPIVPESQFTPPSIAVSHTPESPEPLQEVTVTALVSANQTPPEVGVTVEIVQPLSTGGSISRNDVTILPLGTENVTPQSTRQTFKVKSAKAGLVLLRVHSLELNGSTPPVMHPLVFGATPPPPQENPPVADTNDKTGPRVMGMIPSPDSTGHPVGEPVQIFFNEAVRRELLQQPMAVTINPPVANPRLDLSSDQRELRLDIPDLQPGTTYTITLDFHVRDLNDNALDQDPGVDGNQPFVAQFTPAPIIATNLQEIASMGGVGAVLRGSRAFVLERQGAARGRLVMMDVSNPSLPTKVGEYSLPPFPRDITFIPKYSYATTNASLALDPYNEITRETITNVVTHDLVAIVGGLSGLGQFQWLRILDVTDPTTPKWVGGSLVSFDGISLPGRLRWSPPLLGYLETGSPDRISLVNLQAFLIAQLLIPNQPEYKRLPADGYPGVDLDGDGSYVGPGEQLPLPAHFPIDFGGKVGIVTVPDTSQTILDYAIEGGGSFIGALLDHGKVIGTNGLPDPTQPVTPCYRTLQSAGATLPRELASLEIANGRPRRIATLFHYALSVSNVVASRDLVLVSVRGTQANYLNVIDVTDPLAIQLLAEVPLKQSIPNEDIGSILLRGDGLLAVAAEKQIFLIDPALLATPAQGGQMHPSVVGIIPNIGGWGRSFGSGTTGVHLSADMDGKATIAQTAPRMSFVRFPEDKPFLPETLVTNSVATNTALFSRIQFVDFLQPARLRQEGECSGGLVTNLDSRTHYYVLMEAPGGAGEEVRFAVEALNDAGRAIRKKGFLFPPVQAMNTNALTLLGQSPATNEAPVRPLTARRVSNDPNHPFYNYYLSRPFVAVAEEISREEILTLRAQLDREILWSGHWMRATIDPAEATNAVLGPFAAKVDLGKRVLNPGAERMVPAFPADLIPSPNPGPTVGEMLLPSALETVSAHNRELVLNTTDLALPGRRMPIEFRRTYRGQSLYEGPFGRGWDFNFNQRLVVNPEPCLTITARKTEAESDVARKSDLLFYNGGGEVVIFTYAGTNAPAEVAADPLVQQLGWIPKVARFYLPPAGLFSPMFQFKDGRYVRLEPDGKQYWFNPLGRLEKIYDRYDKNAIELAYNGRGELVVIYDELKRKIELGYYRAPGDGTYRPGVDQQTTRAALFGKVARLRDYSGRDCLYEYDDSGVLVKRLSPEITTAATGGFMGRQEVAYSYSGTENPSRSGLSLIGVRGPEVGGVPAIAIASQGDGGRDAVSQVAVGGRLMSISSSFPNNARHLSENGGQTSVQNSDGSTADLSLDTRGRATNAVISLPGGLSQTNRQEFYANGLIKAVISAEGDRTEFYYDSANPCLRSRGNLLRLRKVPGYRGGSVLEASTQYDGWYNLPSGEKTDFNGAAATLVLSGDHRDLTRIVRGGERELFGVNEFGQLETHTTMDGISTLIQYDAQSGFVTSRKTGTAQFQISYAPVSGGQSDPGLRGKPSQVIDPDGIVTHFLHNELDQVVSEGRAGSLVTHAYDAIGNLVRRVTKVEQQRDVVEEFSYLPMGFLLEHRVENVETGTGLTDLVTRYEPDSAYRVQRVVLPAGEERLFTYDQLGRLMVEAVPGSHTNVFSYDANGNNIAISRAGIVEQYLYDGHDRQVGIIAANGSRNEFIYDNNGNVRTNRFVNSQGQLLAENWVEYDQLNRARKFMQVRDEGVAVASLDYNSGARSMTVTDARGAMATTYLDDMGRPTLHITPNQQVSFTNDLRGNFIGKSTQEADGAYRESYRYNARNQLEAVVDSLGNESVYGLETDGRVLELKDREQHVSRKTYTLLGETKTFAKANGVALTNYYTLGRHLGAVSDALGNQMKFQFDPLERLVTNTLPNGAQTILEAFTPLGEPTRLRMPRGVVTQVGYDFEGKMTNRVVTMGNSTRIETIKYDGLRRPELLSDPAGTIAYQYDLGGFVKAVTASYKFGADPASAADLNFTIRQKADLANFRSELTYGDGTHKVAYGRDTTGRLLSLTPENEEPIIQNQTWVGDKRIGTRLLGANRIRLELAYDGLRRVVGRRYVRPADGSVLAEVRYAYDKNGTIVARQHVHRGGRTELFHYDGGYNLVRADVDARPGMGGADPAGVFPGFEVPAGLPGQWRPGVYAREVSYSAADVIQQIATINPTGLSLAPVATNFGSVDPLLCVTNLDGFQRQVDEIGNVTRTLLSVQLPNGTHRVVPANLVYNDLGQLARVEREDGVRVFHEYNQTGLRIRRVVTGDPSLCEPSDLSFVYDGVKLIEERDLKNGAQLLRRYYYGDDGDELVAGDIRTNTAAGLERYFFLADQQRSVLAVTDSQGNAVMRVQYDPWGQPRIEAVDQQAPAVSSVHREANGIRVVFTEPILPTAPAGDLAALLSSLPGLGGGLSLSTGGSTVPGDWSFDETQTAAGFGSVVRFVPTGTMPATADLVITAGKLRDEWNNGVSAGSLTLDLTRPAGTVLVTGPAPGSTAPSRGGRGHLGSAMLFHGQLYDWDTGLLYCRARFYDPYTGMFLQRDPSGYDDSVNQYAGFANNPVNFRDPSGASISETLSEWGNEVSGVGREMQKDGPVWYWIGTKVEGVGNLLQMPKAMQESWDLLGQEGQGGTLEMLNKLRAAEVVAGAPLVARMAKAGIKSIASSLSSGVRGIRTSIANRQARARSVSQVRHQLREAGMARFEAAGTVDFAYFVKEHYRAETVELAGRGWGEKKEWRRMARELGIAGKPEWAKSKTGPQGILRLVIQWGKEKITRMFTGDIDMFYLKVDGRTLSNDEFLALLPKYNTMVARQHQRMGAQGRPSAASLHGAHVNYPELHGNALNQNHLAHFLHVDREGSGKATYSADFNPAAHHHDDQLLRIVGGSTSPDVFAIRIDSSGQVGFYRPDISAVRKAIQESSDRLYHRTGKSLHDYGWFDKLK